MTENAADIAYGPLVDGLIDRLRELEEGLALRDRIIAGAISVLRHIDGDEEPTADAWAAYDRAAQLAAGTIVVLGALTAEERPCPLR